MAALSPPLCCGIGSTASSGNVCPLLYQASSTRLLPAQLSFGIDGTMAVKTLQGPPVPALIHQKFMLRWVCHHAGLLH